MVTVNPVMSNRRWMVLLAAWFALAVQAQPAIFKDADLALGQELIATNKCEACHA
ncbi:MAG: hypothetical protein RL163_2462, partial [Pseudomonadota bacterium]